MNDFAEIARLLDSLGVKSLFAPILSIIVLLFLIKRYLFNGFTGFVKESVKEWLADQREEIKVAVVIQEKLIDLNEKLTTMQEGLWENRRYLENQNQIGEEMMRQHIAETRSLILILKKKTDKIDEDYKIDTQYFKGEKPNG